MSKLPYMQFYPADWLTDPALTACSLAAQGFWMRVVCLMWKCPQRGVLKTGKQVWGIQEISTALSIDPKIAQDLLNELLKNEVTERRKHDGALINRRQVREERVRKQTRKRVARHRSQCALHSGGCNGDVTGEKSEVRSQKSEVNRRPDDDPLTLLGEFQASYPIEAPHLEFAIQQVRQRAKRPPGSLAFWRKSLAEFFQNWDLEVVAYERERAGAIEARAGQNLQGRTQ